MSLGDAFLLALFFLRASFGLFASFFFFVFFRNPMRASSRSVTKSVVLCVDDVTSFFLRDLPERRVDLGDGSSASALLTLLLLVTVVAVAGG